MAKRTLLCVGGPVDGELYEVDLDRGDQFRVNDKEPLSLGPIGSARNRPKTIRQTIYTVEFVRFGNADPVYFAHCCADPRDAFLKLLAGYKKPVRC